MSQPPTNVSRAIVVAVLVAAVIGTGLAIWGLGTQDRVSSDAFDVRSSALDASARPLEGHMLWALGLFQGETPTPDEIRARLSPALLSVVPAAELIEGAAFVAAEGPFVVRGYEEPELGVMVANLQAANGDVYDLQVAVEPFTGGREIGGLLILLADAERGPFTTIEALAHIVAGWGLLLAGAAAWLLRHRVQPGQLFLVAGILWLAQLLELSDWSLSYTLGLIAGPLGATAVGLGLVIYGQSGTWSVRSIAMALAIAVAGVLTISPLLAIDTSTASLPNQLLSVRHDRSLAVTLNAIAQSVTIATAICLALRLLYRYQQGSAIGKRWRGTFAGMALTCAAVVTPLAVSGLTSDHYDLSQSPLVSLAALVVPVGLGIAIVRDRYALGDVARLAAGPDDGQSRSTLRDLLATTLGDPTIELAFWSPRLGGHVGSDGRPITVTETPTRAVTMLESHDGPVGAVLHDPALRDEPDRVRATAAAVQLALENERLQAELAAELRASRSRLVASADQARRQIERDLHDGAQQRLIALQLSLQLERQRSEREGAGVSSQFLQDVSDELGGAIDELRELGRGLRPSALDHGLRAAVDSLAERSPLPIVTTVANDRAPAEVEEVAYFVISEAVANAIRYSQADHVRVETEVDEHHGTLRLRVADDGAGGAEKNGGTGLQSLEDRVVALDGEWELVSPPAGGTTISVSLPLRSNGASA